MSAAICNSKERPVTSWSMPEDRLPRYPRSEATSEQCYKAILALIVEHAGADFVGVQSAMPEHSLPAYVLFNHPRVSIAALNASRSLEFAAPPKFEQAERAVIVDALRSASGQISGKGGAAERLGLKRTTLQNKMRKLNINRVEYVS
jgi:transcriptional regulator with GAF, ATPase, and Fis domain